MYLAASASASSCNNRVVSKQSGKETHVARVNVKMKRNKPKPKVVANDVS